MAKTKTKKNQKGSYDMSFSLGDTHYQFDTDSIVDTLMDVQPPYIKSKVTFTITKGDRKFEKTVLPRLARRYFMNIGNAQVFSKYITTILNS